MSRKKSKDEKREWFIVYSDLGYFRGLKSGGKLDWSPCEDEAKPLDHLNKFTTIKILAPQEIELIFEYI